MALPASLDEFLSRVTEARSEFAKLESDYKHLENNHSYLKNQFVRYEATSEEFRPHVATLYDVLMIVNDAPLGDLKLLEKRLSLSFIHSAKEFKEQEKYASDMVKMYLTKINEFVDFREGLEQVYQFLANYETLLKKQINEEQRIVRKSKPQKRK